MNALTSVFALSITWALNPPKVQGPVLPASTIVVAPTPTPASSAQTPKFVMYSYTCTCRSIKPGQTNLSDASIRLSACNDFRPPVLLFSIATIFFPAIAISTSSLSPESGSITCPFSIMSSTFASIWCPFAQYWCLYR